MKEALNWLRLSQRDEDSKGFTIVEILVAVTILSVILTIIYGAFASSAKSIIICRKRSDIYQIARLSLHRMAEDISCAFPPKDPNPQNIQIGFIGEDEELDGMPSDRLDFISTSHLKSGQGLRNPGLYEIGYHIDIDPDTDEHILFRREDDSIDDEIQKGGIALELAERIKGLDFKYYDEEGEEADEWYSDDKKSLPRMVKIVLSLEDENEKMLDFTTQVYLEMSGG